MNAQQRFKNFFAGKELDRLPVIEWAPWWDKTIDRWNGEGMNIPYNVLDVQRYFGLDGCIQTYFTWKKPGLPAPSYHGAPIMKDAAEYKRLKQFMYPEPQISKEQLEFIKKTRNDGDTAHFFTVEGFFWMPRVLFGIEPHLFSFYDEPELYHEINRDNTEWLKRVTEYIGNTFEFDFMSFAEDMSYNNGPMLSKETFDEFIGPYYKEIIPYVKRLNTPVFIDSDGDITLAVDWYGDCGADGMFPLERQAGVDVALYIKKRPEMAFLGHFDKMCMKFGEEAMRAEFERLYPSLIKGKVLPAVDHQTPPDVSLENYRIYVKLFKEYAVKAGLEKNKGY